MWTQSWTPPPPRPEVLSHLCWFAAPAPLACLGRRESWGDVPPANALHSMRQPSAESGQTATRRTAPSSSSHPSRGWSSQQPLGQVSLSSRQMGDSTERLPHLPAVTDGARTPRGPSNSACQSLRVAGGGGHPSRKPHPDSLSLFSHVLPVPAPLEF